MGAGEAVVESAAGAVPGESVSGHGGSDVEPVRLSQSAEAESGGGGRSTILGSDGESVCGECPIETCAGDGECDPCVDGVDGDDGAGGPADSGAGDGAGVGAGAGEAAGYGTADGAGSQVPRVLPVPASVRALCAALAGGEWDGMFSSYHGARAAIERNWKRLRGGVAPEPVNRPVSEEVLARALANARDMQSGRLAPTALAAAEAETDGVDAYAENLRERAAADIASKGLDDGSTSVPSLSMAVPKLTEADKRSGDWSIRDGQLSDPRCKTQDGMAAAIQYGMDATGGLCYCGKRVAWRVVVDRAGAARLSLRVVTSASTITCSQQASAASCMKGTCCRLALTAMLARAT